MIVINIVGIVGRAYYNRDNQDIIQLNEAIRRAMNLDCEIVSILLLPTTKDNYVKTVMGEDNLYDCDKEKLDFILDKCDGFILPGGSSWYQFDEYVIDYAIRNKKPLLGICAGFQAICSFFAMDRDRFDMTKKLSDDSRHYGDPEEYVHTIQIHEDTILWKIVGDNCLGVNSLHHDYIDILMKDLIVSAVSEDGVIEAVELRNHPFFIGVQWHPEYLMDEVSVKIFEEFIRKVKELS